MSHRVEVGGEVYAGGEDTLLVLTLRLTIELLPPFRNEVELGLIVYHDLNLLASLIQSIANGCILGGEILVEGNVLATSLLHVLGTLYEGLDVETSTGDGQQANGGEYGEASTDVVGDDERLVTLLVSTGACSTALGIGNGHDDVLGNFLAHLGFTLLLQQAESEGGLCRGARLGDIDDTELLVLQIFSHLREVVFTNIVTSKENSGVGLVLDEPCERVAEGLDDGTGAKIRATDASHYYHLALLTQCISCSLYFVKEGRRDA